jgi:hypothetical protein
MRILAGWGCWAQSEGLSTTTGAKVGVVSLVDVAVNNLSTSNYASGSQPDWELVNDSLYQAEFAATTLSTGRQSFVRLKKNPSCVDALFLANLLICQGRSCMSQPGARSR